MKSMLLFTGAVIAMIVLSFCGCNHRPQKHYDSTTPHYVPMPKLALFTGRAA